MNISITGRPSGRLFLFLVTGILVSACSLAVPERARHDLPGMSRADLVACAGVPDARETLPDGEVLEWKQDNDTQGAIDLKTPLSFELDIGSHGTCHAVARLRDGKVVSLVFTGPSATLLGPDAACGPLVRSCVKK
ncbi:hypothetical protein [Acetobacter oeni]|uniref:hypothetical protein n=1 Tax=Acetobacter oeni TaxID=304077 RepID=UPI0011BEB6D2|nr:hypothetical protein [Acetobacter oeni]MBB3882598.1 hypothetical protein [Acetobacter oeni]NHO18593.1 hypothetical protein [Acetobacter oeni]